jgi:hypothetical protein
MTRTEKLGIVYRSFSQFHENERLIAWVQRQRIIVWLTPRRRKWILLFGALIVGFRTTNQRYLKWDDPAAQSWLVPPLAFAVLLALLYLLYLAAAHFHKLPGAVRRRPQISLHLLFWAILAFLWLTPDGGGVWRNAFVLIVISLPFLLWRCGYMLLSGQRGKARRTTFRDHLFYLWPVWGGTHTPIGKGADYLSQCEAQTPERYARSVLGALKLILLVLVLELLRLVMGAVVYGDVKNPVTRMLGGTSLALPRLNELVIGQKAGSLMTSWIVVYLELIWATLTHAIHGHKWVSLLRLCGFNVFRNTYKPLLAQSIVDFWNRYYYYFKELLVELFFFPTYVRCFVTRPKLRMLTAVFAAAFVGNMYYHFLRASESIAEGDLALVWKILSPRMIYCFALALGIYISMLRQQQRRGNVATANSRDKKFAKVRRIAGVWTFFALVNYWNTRSTASIADQVKFFLSLFGL